MSEILSEKDTQSTAQDAPVLRIIKGNPNASEIAALTLVFTSLADKAAQEAKQNKRQPRDQWGRVADQFNQHTTFNPAAFQNVTFF